MDLFLQFAFSKDYQPACLHPGPWMYTYCARDTYTHSYVLSCSITTGWITQIVEFLFFLSQWLRGLRGESKAARFLGSNPTGGINVFLLRVLCIVQVKSSASGWSVVQRSPVKCGVSQCDLGTTRVRRYRPTRAVETWKIAFHLYLPSKWDDVLNFSHIYIICLQSSKLKMNCRLHFCCSFGWHSFANGSVQNNRLIL